MVRSPKKSAYFDEPAEDPVEVQSEEASEISATSQDLLLIDYVEGQRYRLIRLLEALEPNYIVLLHCDLLSLRTIELYKARRPHVFIRLYFLQYKESGEEAFYLHQISRERQAFEFLMNEKATLLIPRLYDTSRDPPTQTSSQLSQAQRARQGLREEAETVTTPPPTPSPYSEVEEVVRPRVIVDMREFRSELPLALYKRGIDVVPVTLEVGDYVLTPDICVERKSYADLAGSLQSGRLYSQAQQMLRHYATVILLIEGSEERHKGKRRGFRLVP